MIKIIKLYISFNKVQKEFEDTFKCAWFVRDKFFLEFK